MGRLHLVRLLEVYARPPAFSDWRTRRLVRAFQSREDASAWVVSVEAGLVAPPPHINPFAMCDGDYDVRHYVPRAGVKQPPAAGREWPDLALFWGHVTRLSSLGDGLLDLFSARGIERPPIPALGETARLGPWWADHVAPAPDEVRASIWGALDQAKFFEVVTVDFER